MSRIHDALRKADQERSLGHPEQSAMGTPPLTAANPSKAAESTIEADLKLRRTLELQDMSTKRARGPLQDFAEQCAQTEWAPDPGTILFYGAEFHTPGSEEFRTLRSRLDLVRERQQLQTLLITSPMPGDGKTFVAANLAQVIVWQRERHVLLIDADLRASHLHHALGVPEVPGLSDYLKGSVDEFAIVKRGPLENFFFIPGGTPAPNASELIANGRLRFLLKRVAIAFDWIIIDSPPVIPVADARLMAEFCDGVLLVLEAEKTESEQAQLAYREFRGKPFVGVVLNRVDPGSSYGYQYYSQKEVALPVNHPKGKHTQLAKP